MYYNSKIKNTFFSVFIYINAIQFLDIFYFVQVLKIKRMY